ncbi:hypothetical protein [Ancylomarina sp.]|uniref:hypothetical protein n=1 Tax=Ancylomarina sp. TaxID=1970196 RepID=UPI00356517AC
MKKSRNIPDRNKLIRREFLDAMPNATKFDIFERDYKYSGLSRFMNDGIINNNH